jgi:hypothetical protein
MEEEDMSKTKSLFSQSLLETKIVAEEKDIVPDSLTKEQQEILDWANTKLLEAKVEAEDAVVMKNLSTDLMSGVKILKLIEVLCCRYSH